MILFFALFFLHTIQQKAPNTATKTDVIKFDLYIVTIYSIQIAYSNIVFFEKVLFMAYAKSITLPSAIA